MYPVFLDVTKLAVLVIGGGKIATRKVAGLVEAGARPLVIAPQVTQTLQKLAQQNQIRLKQRTFQAGDTADFQLIFICTDQKEVNQQIRQETTDRQLVNDTTQKAHSNFFNPAYFEAQGFGIAISSFGQSPTETKAFKERLQLQINQLSEK